MSARLTSPTRRLAATLLLWLGALATSGHVGSPDVFQAGRAGPYDVRVVVRPPAVIPGRAQVTVRVSGGGVPRQVEVRPVYWRTGTRGAPAGDTLARVPGPDALFAGEVWLMTRGAWTLDVSVEGAEGEGRLAVPVSAFATAKLEMPGATKGALVFLGLLLFGGMLSLVRAGVAESMLPAGVEPDARQRRRGRLAFALAAPVLALLLFGGWTWWQAEDRAYASRMLRPWDVRATVAGDWLRLAITDTLWLRFHATAPLMPDHGRMMHMFVIGEQGDGFAHLHPDMRDSASFVTPLPPLPAGRYRVFADIVHETGSERTLVTQVTLADPGAAAGVAVGPDDAWGAAVPRAVAGVATMADGATVRWIGGVPRLVAGDEAPLRFEVRTADGRPATLEPYLGMSGHAAVMREDGAVYVHLHPTGTASMASQQAFAMRDRGDTTEKGRLRLADEAAGADPHAGHAMPPGADPSGVVDFPYAFPKAGQYRLWVQVKRDGRVGTVRFDVEVGEGAAR